jgi:AcrR family transcriptional regulator
MVGENDVRSRKRDRTRAEIVAVAWQLVRQDGIAALSLRDLAARTGMRAPSLYTYFGSKNDLYDAMYAAGMREFADAMEHTPLGRNAHEGLRNRARTFVRVALADPSRFQLLFERPVPDFVPSPEHLALGVTNLARTAEIARAAGLPDQRALDLFLATTRGLVAMQIANEPGGDRWASLVDDAVDMLVAHYRRAARARRRSSRGN